MPIELKKNLDEIRQVPTRMETCTTTAMTVTWLDPHETPTSSVVPQPRSFTQAQETIVLSLSIHTLRDTKLFLDNDGVWQCDPHDTDSAYSEYKKSYSNVELEGFTDPRLQIAGMLWALNNNFLTKKEAEEFDMYFYINSKYYSSNDRRGPSDAIADWVKSGKNIGNYSYNNKKRHFQTNRNEEYRELPLHKQNPIAALLMMAMAPYAHQHIQSLLVSPNLWGYGHPQPRLVKLINSKQTRYKRIPIRPRVQFANKDNWRTIWLIIEHALSKPIDVPKRLLLSLILFYYEDMQHHSFSRELLPNVVSVLDKLVTNYNVPLQRIPKGILRRCCGESTLERCREDCEKYMQNILKRNKDRWNDALRHINDWESYGNLLVPLSIRGITRYYAACEHCSSDGGRDESCDNDVHKYSIHPAELIASTPEGSRLRETLVNGYEGALLAAKTQRKSMKKEQWPFDEIKPSKQRRVLKTALNKKLAEPVSSTIVSNEQQIFV